MSDKFKILVADRNGNIRNLLKRELETEGYQVDLAGDGKELIRIARGHYPPDLVIMDLDLPLVDGIKALSMLRDRIPPLLVVIHSSLAELSHPPELGLAKEVIEKGEDLDRLKAVVAGLARKKTITDSLKSDPIQKEIQRDAE